MKDVLRTDLAMLACPYLTCHALPDCTLSAHPLQGSTWSYHRTQPGGTDWQFIAGLPSSQNHPFKCCNAQERSLICVAKLSNKITKLYTHALGCFPSLISSCTSSTPNSAAVMRRGAGCSTLSYRKAAENRGRAAAVEAAAGSARNQRHDIVAARPSPIGSLRICTMQAEMSPRAAV